MQIRALIVDDEPLARSRINNLLQKDPEISVFAECRNGIEAVKMIQEKKPDLIFLDVNMPDLDGFGVLKKMHVDYDPFIIFVTAYSEFALKAFDVHAIDYLLKPFDEDRFVDSVETAKAQIKLKKTSELNEKLIHLIKEYQYHHGNYIKTFEIKERGRVKYIDADDVYLLEANGNYVTLYLADSKHLYRSTMNAIETELDPEGFLRVHRSFMLNKRYIKQVKYLSNNEYRFLFKNGREIISGRSFKEKIMSYVSHLAS